MGNSCKQCCHGNGFPQHRELREVILPFFVVSWGISSVHTVPVCRCSRAMGTHQARACKTGCYTNPSLPP